MRKVVLCVLLVLAATTAVVAQNTTTWIDAYGMLPNILPGSMLGVVTNGIFVDEWDVLIMSPAELSNYEGYGIFTAYGNYDQWRPFVPINTPVDDPLINPFASSLLLSGGGTDNIGPFLLGYTMPILSFRGGIIAGFEPAERTDQVEITVPAFPFTATGFVGNWSEAASVETNAVISTPDAADFTRVWNVAFTKYTDTSNINAGVGLDLGFIGASLYADVPGSSYTLGGSYSYAYNLGTDPGWTATDVPADTVMSRTVYVGLGTSGAAAAYPTNAGPLTVGGVVELPLDLGISLPITAAVYVQSDPGNYNPATSALEEPVDISINTAQVGGGAANSTNTLDMLYGEDGTNDMLQDAQTGKGTDGTQSTAALQALFGGVAGQALALDAARLSSGSFGFGVTGDVQPAFPLNDLLTVRTKAGIGFQAASNRDTEAGTKSARLSYNDGDASNDTLTYAEDSIVPNDSMSTTLNLEVGGLLFFSTPDDVLSIGSGIFYMPSFMNETTAAQNTVTTVSGSYADGAAAVPAAILGDDDADILGGLAQGSFTDVQTITPAGNTVLSTNSHAFAIPVAAKIVMAKARMTLFGGYNLYYQALTTTTTTPDTTTTNVLTVTDPGGSVVGVSVNGLPFVAPTATQPLVPLQANSTVGTERTENTGGMWFGQLMWMLRWQPIESLMVDIYGESIMNALNFSIFTTSNLSTIISNLGLSVTFRVK